MAEVISADGSVKALARDHTANHGRGDVKLVLDLAQKLAAGPDTSMHNSQHTTRATTTPPTQVGGDLQRPPGNRVSQRLRDHGSGARAAS